MSEMRDKAKDAVGGAVESAADIARDQLDTFKKLAPNTQKIMLGVVAVVIVIIVAIVFWPKTIDVTVTRWVEDNIGGNQVIVLNNEKFDLGEITVLMNKTYEIKIDNIPAGDQITIYVQNFYPQGNPSGKPPADNYVPKRITVTSKDGSRTHILQK